MTCVINLANASFRVDRRHTCDHLVDASIKIIKYLNGPNNGFIGPQISLNSFKEFEWFHFILDR
jgi:hypothetical protein